MNKSVNALRRESGALLCALASVIAASFFPNFANAQSASATYPTKPVRIVVSYAAGGGVDMMARMLAEHLSKQMGQTFLVENKAGASGSIGADAVAKSAPDGYTLLAGGNPELTYLPAVNEKMPYDAIKDLSPVMIVAQVPSVLVVNASSPIQSVAQFMERARSDKGLAYATPGRGTAMHLAFEMLNLQHGTRLVHVPYKGGGPATADIVAGQVDSAVINAPPLMPHIQSGKLRALAVLQNERSALLPQVPTLKESTGIDGVFASAWFGISLPARTPVEIRTRLEEAIARALTDPEFKGRLQKAGMDVVALPGAKMAQVIASESAFNQNAVKRLGFKPD